MQGTMYSGALLYMEDGSVSMVDDSTSQSSSSIAPPSRSWVSGSIPPQRPAMRFRFSGGPSRANHPSCDFCRGPGHYFRQCPQLVYLPQDVRDYIAQVRDSNLARKNGRMCSAVGERVRAPWVC